ncbi:uncharacterized protein LOC132868062 [Neoarius graeffei]|uniref:uncharacterized protein LOC132868062 n=1 Tax=Neoarius graeffei TaxID=443677 RepID=UPI00298C5B58|nr:uncharacterized protein LOC132868062 [Neoarius graeffei]
MSKEQKILPQILVLCSSHPCVLELGNPEETRRLIRFRAENEQRFLKSKAAAKKLWETLIKELGLEGKVTSQQASKKWENLKKKYKELKNPLSGSGTDEGQTTACTWQFFEDMHEVLGSRPSIDPPVVVESFCPDADPTLLLMEIAGPSLDTFFPMAASTSDADTSTTSSPAPIPPTPSPKKKRKRKLDLINFLAQESEKAQKRHEETKEKTECFLGLFEKLVEKL